MNDSTHQIEATADRIRDDLAGTLRELDRRRACATDLRLQVKNHLGGVLVAGAVAAVLLGAAIASTLLRRRAMKRKRIQQRFNAMQRAWKYPERLATHAKDRPMHMELLRRLTMAASIAVVTEVCKRAAQQIVRPGARPSSISSISS
jgi:hypothetical protein